MASVGTQDVEAAVAEMVAVLAPLEDVDWQARAGTLEPLAEKCGKAEQRDGRMQRRTRRSR